MAVHDRLIMKIVLHVTVAFKEGLGCPCQPRHLGSRATSNEAEWKMLHQCGPLRLMKYELHWILDTGARKRYRYPIPTLRGLECGVRSDDSIVGVGVLFQLVPYRTVQ